MTLRRPLVLVNGKFSELPLGDTLPGGGAAYLRAQFTATAAQTTFLTTYTPGYLDVYLNGVKLRDTVDFTATNGTSFVLAVGAANLDEVESVAYATLAAQVLTGTIVRYGSASINFGTGAHEASVAVTGLSDILSTDTARAFILASDTSINHSAKDHRYFGVFATLTCGQPTAGVGFTIYANTQHKLTGAWTVRYQYQN